MEPLDLTPVEPLSFEDTLTRMGRQAKDVAVTLHPVRSNDIYFVAIAAVCASLFAAAAIHASIWLKFPQEISAKVIGPTTIIVGIITMLYQPSLHMTRLLPNAWRFYREYRRRIRALRRETELFDQAVLTYQEADCPLRENPERYAGIVSQLRARRETLAIECEEITALHAAALEPYVEAVKPIFDRQDEEEKRLEAQRRFYGLQSESQRQLLEEAENAKREEAVNAKRVRERAARIAELERLLPAFDDGKLGPNTTKDLSAYVGIAELKRQLS